MVQNQLLQATSPELSEILLQILDSGRTDELEFNVVDVEGLLIYKDKRKLAGRLLSDLRSGSFINPDLVAAVEDTFTPTERQEIFNRVVLSLKRAPEVRSAIKIYEAIAPGLSKRHTQTVVDSLMRDPISLADPGSDARGLLAVLDSRSARKVLEAVMVRNLNSSGSASESKFPPVLVDFPLLGRRLNPSDALDIWQLCWKNLTASRSAEELAWLHLGFNAVASRLSPVDAQKASALILSAMQQAENVEDLSNLVRVLGTLKQRVPTEIARDATALLLQRIGKSKGRERRILIGQLGEFGPSLAPADVDEPVRLILAEMRSMDVRSAEEDSHGLFIALSEFSDTMSDGRVREVVASVNSSMEGTSDQSFLLSILLPLKLRLASVEVQQILGTLLSRADKDPYWFVPVETFFTMFGDRCSLESAESALQKWIDTQRLSSAPSCEGVTLMIRNPKDPRVMDLLKWPTCSREGRDILISRLDDLVTDEVFGSKDPNGRYHADVWGKFLPWARKQGLDVESPPLPPDLDRLEAQIIDG